MNPHGHEVHQLLRLARLPLRHVRMVYVPGMGTTRKRIRTKKDTTPTPDELVLALLDEFKWWEDRDLMVGTVFLNPQEGTLLAGSKHFDMLSPDMVRKLALLDRVQPGVQFGMFFGATVRILPEVPKNHAALVPSGMTLVALEGSACICLGLGSGLRTAERQEIQRGLDQRTKAAKKKG